MESDVLVQFNVKIPKKLRTAFKNLCEEEDKDYSDLMVELIEKHLKKKGKSV